MKVLGLNAACLDDFVVAEASLWPPVQRDNRQSIGALFTLYFRCIARAAVL